jgi:hypothetical protein
MQAEFDEQFADDLEDQFEQQFKQDLQGGLRWRWMARSLAQAGRGASRRAAVSFHGSARRQRHLGSCSLP